MLVFGDFHQMGPVKDRILCKGFGTAGDEMELGHRLWREFTTAVELDEQVRVTDPVWQGVLSRMRFGNCTRDDITVIRGLELKVRVSVTHCEVP